MKAVGRNHYDVVAITHLDDDHIRGASEFFHLKHHSKYQGNGRVEIQEMWVPAAVIIEDVPDNKPEAQVIQAEARYRLINNEGIKVVSRPDKLDEWLNQRGSDLTDESLVIDAGQLMPPFTLERHGIEFFIHSPFAEVCDDGVEDRNEASLIFQAVLRWRGQDTQVMLTADTAYENLAKIVTITEYHKDKHGDADRLGWDIFYLPHHCSYTALNSLENKGTRITVPVPEVTRLFEQHGAEGGIIISTSDPIPNIDTVQPPHMQAANYYKEKVVNPKSGQFLVTMEHPLPSRLEPLVIEIDEYGHRVKKQITPSSSTIVSQPVRSGRAG